MKRHGARGDEQAPHKGEQTTVVVFLHCTQHAGRSASKFGDSRATASKSGNGRTGCNLENHNAEFRSNNEEPGQLAPSDMEVSYWSKCSV
ncbi:hypothetical protein E2562_007901 [Oryza meyeriana var. granulata]|uniref:Uncharacterized protein n=1 Tax=Oryza meyeriana var. granulata TaxID=110450 RepID=A0A6G1DVX4_9ORYZ|nr:hypothetical protein E2562_007901 [Oryza meyeriana var. granulata]